MASFSQCSSAQKLQKEAPAQFGEVYYQNWTAGVSGGGSGLNLFIPVMNTSVELDSVYFKGRASKLEMKNGNEILYVGRFQTDFNQPKDVVMSSDANEEYNNQLIKTDESMPFELKDHECVVSYTKSGKTQYYKISNIKEREPLNYPSAPPNPNKKFN